jgi:murein DD-endopeptidase MepM/ murein hydrolase activator NlpD
MLSLLYKSLIFLSIVIFVFPVFTNSPSIALATKNVQTEIEGLKQQIEERNEEIAELKEQEGEYSAAASHAHEAAESLEELVLDYNIQIRAVENDIYIKQKEITSVTLDIKRTELEIKAKEASVKRVHGYISAVLREIYKNDGEQVTELVLQYDDFSDFFDQIEYRNALQADLKENLDGIQDLKRKLEEEKADLDSHREELNQLKTNLENENIILDNQKDNKESLLEDTKNEEWRYKELLQTVKDKQELIRREIFELEDQLRLAVDNSLVPSPKAGVLIWPTEGILTQGYGCTQFAKTSNAYPSCFHNGIDVAAAYGTPVMSARKGIVIAVQNAPYAYGKWIAIEHDNGLVTLYGHLSLQSVSVGQKVDWGEVIGYMGSTGYSTGSHLHFTVYAPGTFTTKPSSIAGTLPLGAPINPFDYLP